MKRTCVHHGFTSLILLTGLLSSLQLTAQRYQKHKENLDIVFIGNSITHGATLKNPATEAPPVSTCVYLRGRPGIGKVQFSNQGVSGFTTVDFLPATGTAFEDVISAANGFAQDKGATLVFSIMLGTNDSAIKGPNGSPVSPDDYRLNLKAIIDMLLHDYPTCKIVVHNPIWYSPNTYNGAEYLQQGLTRLQSYFPEINTLLRYYTVSAPGQVFAGDRKAFRYFRKHHLDDYTPQKGHRGTFYLHPNKAGAVKLGIFWGKAIYKALEG
jgi:lysophospholipase L1-like esterase